jgi:four helix bundle protein
VITSYRTLRVWQLGVDLAEDVYRLSAGFPRPEATILIGQLQRAAITVPAQLALGQTRGIPGDYAEHVAMAHGSLSELATYVEIAQRLGYLSERQSSQLLGKADALGRQISALRTALASKPPQS